MPMSEDVHKMGLFFIGITVTAITVSLIDNIFISFPLSVLFSFIVGIVWSILFVVLDVYIIIRSNKQRRIIELYNQ